MLVKLFRPTCLGDSAEDRPNVFFSTVRQERYWIGIVDVLTDYDNFQEAKQLLMEVASVTACGSSVISNLQCGSLECCGGGGVRIPGACCQPPDVYAGRLLLFLEHNVFDSHGHAFQSNSAIAIAPKIHNEF